MRFLRQSLSVLVVALCAIAIAGAQENGEITGVITDASKAVVPNATITLTQTTTGAVHTTESNAGGWYDFPGLAIGTYELKATAKGFKSFTKSGLIVNTAQTLRADIL